MNAGWLILLLALEPEARPAQPTSILRTGADSLLAWVEGTRNGTLRRIEFPYRRTPCAGH